MPTSSGMKIRANIKDYFKLQNLPGGKLNNNGTRKKSSNNNIREKQKMQASAQIVVSGAGFGSDGFQGRGNLFRDLVGSLFTRPKDGRNNGHENDPYIREVEEAWKDFERKAIF